MYNARMGTISELWLKIKNAAEGGIAEWGLIAIVILVGLASFGLGRLSTLEEMKPSISVKEAQTATTLRPVGAIGLVVASRKGSTYHYPWCPGAAVIAEANKVWFKSEEAAQKAGYAPAKNCKGLGAK